MGAGELPASISFDSRWATATSDFIRLMPAAGPDGVVLRRPATGGVGTLAVFSSST